MCENFKLILLISIIVHLKKSISKIKTFQLKITKNKNCSHFFDLLKPFTMFTQRLLKVRQPTAVFASEQKAKFVWATRARPLHKYHCEFNSFDIQLVLAGEL